jgi:mitofilin
VTNRYSLADELGSLRQAASRDSFIIAILNSIPSQALSNMGIQSESCLKERFTKVKHICDRVAMVPETGGGLGTYAISYLQSLLTIHSWLPTDVPADTDLSKLHVYDLLHLADAQLKKGDLEGAVYYMNYLKGEPKNVAKDWLSDARLYLETKQAIQLIQTYISANAAVFNK